jgi:hypothetical protein
VALVVHRTVFSLQAYPATFTLEHLACGVASVTATTLVTVVRQDILSQKAINVIVLVGQEGNSLGRKKEAACYLSLE